MSYVSSDTCSGKVEATFHTGSRHDSTRLGHERGAAPGSIPAQLQER